MMCSLIEMKFGHSVLVRLKFMPSLALMQKDKERICVPGGKYPFAEGHIPVRYELG